MKLAAYILSIIIFVGLVVFLSRGVSNDPNSKLSGPARPLEMRYLATGLPSIADQYGPSGDPAMAAMEALGIPRVDERVDETPTVPEEPDVSPYATDAERKEADDKANEDAKDYLEEQKTELKSAIAKEKDPEKKKQLQEDLRILEGQIAEAKKYVPQAAPPRPASARAPLPKKPEEPKPWFTEGNAPDTVFEGTDPLSGLVPAATQIKGNVYPSHLEWEAPVPYTEKTPGWGRPVVFPEFLNKPVEAEGWAGQLGTGTEFITKKIEEKHE